MNVYDPHAHATRDYDDCEVLGSDSGIVQYATVRSLKEGHWFALHFPTGTSHKFEDLDEYIKIILENQVSVKLLTEKLMDALSWIADGLLSPNATDEARQFALDEVERNYGKTAVDSVIVLASHEGYGVDQIVNAFTCLDQVPLDKTIIESVEITKISELVEDV